MNRSGIHSFFYTVVASLLFAQILFGSTPWSHKKPSQWSSEDVAHILTDSPWAKQGTAKFPQVLARDESPGSAQADPDGAGVGSRAGLPLPGGKVGRWDGGVGRDPGTPPTLPVTVRWDSALPMREALVRVGITEEALARSSKDYVITVIGLWPGNTSQRLQQASLDHMREGLVASTALLIRGQKPLTPDDVMLDERTGAIYFFFSRDHPIVLDDKEATFRAQFGPLQITEKFRLKDMTAEGRLQL